VHLGISIDLAPHANARVALVGDPEYLPDTVNVTAEDVGDTCGWIDVEI
jgi:hypothetical protein